MGFCNGIVPAFFLGFASLAPSASAVPEAVRFDGRNYIGLSRLLAPDLLNGSEILQNWGREIAVSSPNGNWTIANGGDQFVPEGGTTTTLQNPVLVIEGMHYLPAREFAPLVGFDYDESTTPRVSFNGTHVDLSVDPVDSPHRSWRIENLRPVHEYLQLEEDTEVFLHLNPDFPTAVWPNSTRALLRRTVLVNGEAFGILTRDDSSLESVAVPMKALSTATRLPESIEAKGRLARLRKKESRLTARRNGSIDHGPRSKQNQFAITVDLCWSLRPYESEFFECTQKIAESGQPIDLTLFVSGRWIQQHPEEMHKLIELSRVPNLHVLWALHSWDHPKEGDFMNAYTPEELEQDTLKLERALLEWGMVPSAFYRFPGLIHDVPRLCKIIDMDLFSIDCDSWVNMMMLRVPPHRMPARSGSILLIHGNGNEPAGIPAFYRWLSRRPTWRWSPLPDLLEP